MERILLIHPDMPDLEPERGFHDINGPSLIRVPDWVENPLGRYYLYFAHHNGSYIRMAYADDLAGPYTIYKPGVLHLENTIFRSHIASPDVHIDDENHRFIMYFHGPYPEGGQQTAMSESTDGLNFAAHDVRLGTSYFRVFEWNDMFYASAFSKIYRSPDRNKPFELRKTDFFPWRVRHTAVLLKSDDMWVFQSRYGDAPEHIMVSTLKLTPDWNEWNPSEPITVLKPEKDFEGVNEPVEPSVGGLSRGPVHQLRDPAIYREDDRIYLLYSVAGEYGIAITQVDTAPSFPSR